MNKIKLAIKTIKNIIIIGLFAIQASFIVALNIIEYPILVIISRRK